MLSQYAFSLQLSEIRVLLVEDNPADVRLLREAVRQAGRTRLALTHVDTLGAALDRLSRETFDVVLLDLSLPDADGLDTLVRTHGEHPTMPIVVLTGLDDEALAFRAVREGAQDYLVKGEVTGNNLVRAIRYATERRRAIVELQRREEYYRSLIENALDLIVVVERSGQLRYVSPSVEKLFGIPHGALTGTSLLARVAPEDRARVGQILQRDLAVPGSTQAWEFRLLCQDERGCIVEAVGKNLEDHPEVGGIVVNSREVTERKAGEQALRDANETVRAVIKASPLAVYTIDLEGRIRTWNTAAERIFGLTESDVIGRPLEEVVDEPAGPFAARLRRAIAGEQMEGYETRQRRAGQSFVEVSAWTAELRGESGAITGVVAAVADITERKRLEQKSQQSQKMEAIGNLAGGIAHDFNNLLQVITGYGNMITADLPADTMVRENMEEVLKAADRATAMTKQLLAFSRRQLVQPQILDVNDVLRGLDRLLRRLIEEDIVMSIHLASSLGTTRADKGQLEQVILNLVVNAKDAMPLGGKLIIETANTYLDEHALRQHPSAQPGPFVMIAVSDTGQGIPPDVLDHLFEPFFTTKEPGKGTGLGLSTSYGIVRQCKGHIWVYSEVGIGTTFKVYLPSFGDVLVAPPPREATPLARGTETILVVEDEDGVRHVMEEMLRRLGYTVLAAADPHTALAAFNAHKDRIDLVLTDVIMPGLSGREMADLMREQAPELKVLFVSGYTDNAIVHHGIEPGVAFIQKPVNADALAAKVREVLAAEPK